MEELIITRNNPTEYFCFDCKQLRLSLCDDKSHCGNCGSSNIKRGKVGELDKHALKGMTG